MNGTQGKPVSPHRVTPAERWVLRGAMRWLNLLGVAALIGAAAPVWSESAVVREQERQRISREQAQVQAAHDEARRACYQRFVVTACLDEARAERRRALDELQRQESLLNDAERRERAQERLQRIDERVAQRAAEEKRLAEQAARRSAALPPAARAEDLAAPAARETQAEQRRQAAQEAQQRAAQREAQSAARATESAATRAQTQLRQQEAAARRLERDQRLADPARRPASDLPRQTVP